MTEFELSPPAIEGNSSVPKSTVQIYVIFKLNNPYKYYFICHRANLTPH